MVKETVFNVVENDGKLSLIKRTMINFLYFMYFSEYLKKFLAKDQPTNILEEALSFPEQIKKLSDAIDLVTSELKQKIRQDYPSLLKHSTNASKYFIDSHPYF